jgi:hypothetical protein
LGVVVAVIASLLGLLQLRNIGLSIEPQRSPSERRNFCF